MQSPTIRRRVAAATPAATVAGPVVPELPVLRFHMPNGLLEIQDAATVVALLKNEQAARLAAQAEQAALSTVYRLSGKPDDSRPYGGLLTRRLDISLSTAYELLNTGRLKFTCLGKKGYKVTELACRQFLGDVAT